jgi:hypothetical protein
MHWAERGHRAAALTTTEPGTELSNAVVFCHVTTWLTGPRTRNGKTLS